MVDSSTYLLPREIDLANARSITEDLIRVLKTGHSSVRVVCSNVEYIDSVGMAMLFKTGEQLATRGVRLVLTEPSPFIQSWLAVTGLDLYYGEGAQPEPEPV